MAGGGSNVAIRIAADFVGLPAFKKADTAVDKLYKSTKKLAGAFGIAYSAQAIARFSASAVRAFAAEEKQILQLTNTVKNLGLAFAAPEVNDYIEDLERLTGITREQLQPAFQKLLTQTGSIAKSQKIMSAAVDISLSGTMSLEQAATALTQAYVGNKKGLRLLNLGLSSAELAAMDFEAILQKIGETYEGSTKAVLDSTAVKFDKIKVAANNAKESIGEGLVDAFGILAGNGNLDVSTSKLEKFGEALAGIIRRSAGFWKTAFNPSTLFSPTSALAKSRREPQAQLGSPAQWRKNAAALAAVEKKAAAATLKAENAKLAVLNKQLAAKKAQAALDKANALIAKAKEKFDIEGIQLAAALANEKISIDERSRLELMQATWDLEQAVAQNDEKRIASATALLQQLLGQYNILEQQKLTIEEMYKIFQAMGANRSLIDLLNLEDALNLANQIAALGMIQLPKDFPASTAPIVSKQEADFALASALSQESMDWSRHEAAIAANRRSFTGALPTGVAPQAAAPNINLTVNGAIDPEGTARTIVDVLSRSYGRGAIPAELLTL